jgi:hypothetical protein
MKRLLQCAILCSVAVAPAQAATKVYARLNGSGIYGYQLADPTHGLASTNSVTKTQASGTDIQQTETNGGPNLSFITNPLASGVTLNSTETCNMWGLESNTLANASFRCRIYHWTSAGGAGAALCTGNVAGELTASSAVKTSSCAISSEVFAAGDRIIITFFLENCSATSGCPTGTMAGSTYTVTMSYDGQTTGATGDTYVSFTEALSFAPLCGAGSATIGVFTCKQAPTIDAAFSSTTRTVAIVNPLTNPSDLVAWGFATASTTLVPSFTGAGCPTWDAPPDAVIHNGSTSFVVWHVRQTTTATCSFVVTAGTSTTIESGVVEITGSNGTVDGHSIRSTGSVGPGSNISPTAIVTTADGALIITTLEDQTGSANAYGATGTGIVIAQTQSIGAIMLQVQTSQGSITPAYKSPHTATYFAGAIGLDAPAAASTFIPPISIITPGL